MAVGSRFSPLTPSLLRGIFSIFGFCSGALLFLSCPGAPRSAGAGAPGPGDPRVHLTDELEPCHDATYLATDPRVSFPPAAFRRAGVVFTDSPMGTLRSRWPVGTRSRPICVCYGGATFQRGCLSFRNGRFWIVPWKVSYEAIHTACLPVYKANHIAQLVGASFPFLVN